MMNSQAREAGSKLAQPCAVGKGLEHSDNVGTAMSVPPEPRYVLRNSCQVDPKAALCNCAGKVLDRLHHACMARGFEQHRVSWPQQWQQLVFQLVRIANSGDGALGIRIFKTFGGALQIAIAHQE